MLNCTIDLAFSKIKIYMPSRMWLQIVDLCKQVIYRSFIIPSFVSIPLWAICFGLQLDCGFYPVRMSFCSNEPNPQWTDKSSRTISRLIYTALLIYVFHSSWLPVPLMSPLVRFLGRLADMNWVLEASGNIF